MCVHSLCLFLISMLPFRRVLSFDYVDISVFDLVYALLFLPDDTSLLSNTMNDM